MSGVYAHPAFAGYIGVARADITPSVGIYARNWGAATHDTAEGVHRPLTATALTLQAGPNDPPLALLVFDLGWWRSKEDEWHVRGGILEALGLDPSRLLVSLTHTHAGPSLCREDADKPGGEMVAPYLDFLRDTATDLIRRAIDSAVPATLTFGTGRCGVARNRDLPDPAGGRLLTGFHPHAPADDALLVGRVSDDDTGETLATLVNYACHPVTLSFSNRLLSPDFVGALRETLEAATEHAPCLFLQGASGELAPRDSYADDPEITDAVGGAIAFAAASVLDDMLPSGVGMVYGAVVESGAPLAVWERVPRDPPTAPVSARIESVPLALKPDLPALAEIDAALAAAEDRAQAERLRRKRQVRRYVGDGDTVPYPVWLWEAGELLFVAHPGEAYSRLQTDLRAAFPGRAVVVLNVANGWYGYLAPESLYAEDIYAVWQSPFAAGSLERVIGRLTT